MSSSLHSQLSVLTISEIKYAVGHLLKGCNRLTHDELIEHVVRYAPRDVLQQLLHQVQQAESSHQCIKHSRDIEGDELRSSQRRVSARVAETVDGVDSMRDVPVCEKAFLDIATDTEARGCYADFYKHGDPAGFQFRICAVCGREMLTCETDFSLRGLTDIRHLYRLYPAQPHPAHTLFQGALLCPKGVLHPRVFVFKLFPRSGGAGFDDSCLQRGLRGTVSTYALDVEGVATMLSGNLMPRPPSILASVLSITFATRRSPPQQWLRNTFKANNAKYYGRIEIDSSRLQALPVDDVPAEIMAIVRRSSEEDVADVEHEGYVPEDDAQSEEGVCCYSDSFFYWMTMGVLDPVVIPLEMSGAIDTDLSQLPASDLTLWALSNLWKEGEEGGYAIRPGSRPVSEFGRGQDGVTVDQNFFVRAFPCLFPYGLGGPEDHKAVSLSLSEHSRWLLEYHDRRFRRHPVLPFLIFGILQKREALLSARIQAHRRSFKRDLPILSGITMAQMHKARLEEESGQPISNPAVKLLHTHLHATAGRVQGSDEARYRLRSQIWSTSVVHGPPTLWMTINPSDLHDPIAQVLAGEQFDLQDLTTLECLTREQRARNIAEDPLAASKFFQIIIGLIFRSLFGVHTYPSRVVGHKGIFGKVAAYFGVMESQARGTLHLHLILWLLGSPPADVMQEKLHSAEFREQLLSFIKANIRAYTPGLESAESIQDIPCDKNIAFTRPPDPQARHYEKELQEFETKVVRTEQVHTCKLGRCLVSDCYGRVHCKRHAPWPTSPCDYVNENGEWGCRRSYGMVNAWNPAVSVNARCNNDVKLLTHSRETRDIAYYITMYAAKKQKKTSNMSAVLAKGFEYHEVRLSESEVAEVREQQRLLLYRLVQTINHEQELAAPMVMNYLMGWGDTICSHHYVPFFWSGFAGLLLKQYPELLG
ncbi:hypothetical protein BDN72DRAFT_777848 [Pluteus cervinus]|uniref:Uncharacterized protein n=1 Tax=Pluteus cervinus TaxID=181527 RepID=A0ACD3A822_9AGAR|nr:hypothetical protein BDN72DRAFT_777848 [Pluteus cervinus]